MNSKKIISIETNGTFEGVVDNYTSEVKNIACELRKLVSAVMPGVTEVPWSKQKTIGYGVGAKKMSEHFCYIAPQKEYVNLGFMYGANLADPKGILEGSGKQLRHIKIKKISDIKKPEIKNLVKKASQHLPRL